jgi:hypothetical protein
MWVDCKGRFTSPKKIVRGFFTDRDRGEGFVLSATTQPLGSAKREYIKANGVDTAGDGPVEGHLFGVGEQIGHLNYEGHKCKKI